MVVLNIFLHSSSWREDDLGRPLEQPPLLESLVESPYLVDIAIEFSQVRLVYEPTYTGYIG